jgi:predicted alpha/beta-fold hydrolase
MIFSSPFKPAWWLAGAHLQTIWPSLKKRKIAISLKRERLDLPDGDFLDLDWTEGNLDKPLVILLHGLEGSIESSYAKGMLAALSRAGLRSLFMNFRSCSDEPNRHLQSYHAGETRDLSFVLETLKKRYPSLPIGAVGVSLGGNVLLKYLGESGLNNPISAAVAISVPFLLNRCADKLEKGFSQIYQKHLLSLLKKKILKKEIPTDLRDIKTLKTFWEFDHFFTAPLYGFTDAKDYYNRSSSFYYLPEIKRKTLLIQALNDPFLPSDAIPKNLPPNVELELSKEGGHVGFISGNLPWRPKWWLEERVPAYLKSSLS